MRTIKTNVYKFDELSDDAKEKARDWYRQGYDGADVWEYVKDDAKEIGLKITELRPTGIQGNNDGEFITTARECAEKIIKNHGETCETFKTARAYLKDIDALELDEDDEFVDEDAADELTKEFKYSLLEDYRVIYEKDEEYQNSDEVVDESIIANDYEFSEDGARA